MNLRRVTKRLNQENLPLSKRTKVLEVNNASNDLQTSSELKIIANKSNTSLSTPPTTPRKQRIKDVSNQIITPNDKRGTKKLSFLSPPTTPTKPKNSSVYSKAKMIFQRGINNNEELIVSHLVGRNEEAKFLNNFLLENLQNNTCNSLYISGPPGTGKTAQVNVSFNHLMNGIGKSINDNVFMIAQHKVKLIKINCMSIANPENIFHEIYCGLSSDKELLISYTKKKSSDDLFRLLTTSKLELTSTIILLDEMDCLITKDQQVLFQLFNFASLNNSENLSTKLILIGISNALDLTDKFLPRLKRNGLDPKALPFLPYTADQIRDIITSKLKLLIESNKENEPSLVPLIHPAAIQLCCKKSASITGDLRKAFDICYKSIESVENELRKNNSIVEINQLTFESAPKVLISHVAKICSTSFGGNSLTKLNNLNLLQKAVLCCLFNYQNNSISNPLQKDPNVNSFYDFYIKHSIDHIDKLLGKLKKGEFLEIISALESTSVIILSDPKIARKSSIFNVDIGTKNIKPNVPYDDLLKAIGNIGVLKKILHGSATN